MLEIQVFHCSPLRSLRREISGINYFAQIPPALRRNEHARIGFDRTYSLKTVRIAEMMLCKAVEMADAVIVRNLHTDNDGSLSEKLLAQGGYPGRIMVQLKYRELYKKSFSLSMMDLTDDQMDRLMQLTSYRRGKEAEEEIASRAGVHPSEVILDMPSRELLISEPRIGKTEVPILDDDKVRPLSRHSPLAKALQSRSVFDWAIMVSCPERYKTEVAKAAAKSILSSRPPRNGSRATAKARRCC